MDEVATASFAALLLRVSLGNYSPLCGGVTRV